VAALFSDDWNIALEMATRLVFRRLLPEEFQDAYAIVCQASDWLGSKGYQHWLVPVQAYCQRHAAGENYGLWMKDVLVAVVSLGQHGPRAWQEYLPSTEFIWLGTLVTAIEFKGRNLGMVTLNQAEALLRQQGVNEIYLDCYYDTGFLPRYYESAGYKWVARKGLIFADGSVHDSVLMCKELRADESTRACWKPERTIGRSQKQR
jgi:GNAT superfamily N-acetyltransferase